MSAPSKTVQHACQVLRHRVRFRAASFHLPERHLGNVDDTTTIAKATRLYIETWVVPLLDAIETGDTELLRDLTVCTIGEPIGHRYPQAQADETKRRELLERGVEP